ncbi:murein biosynthesis integral membrane protein MurJ [Nitrosococcus watsonii]|uniref:Probable lipid II flippase MurJ n=1 Tax=Nitrosococcus watsoni (strain C-113) TaxID=105559 RepID=D8K4K5_NITWC|nr:murein biosynthesis integral membrane protein MurJ [Nitrosococcus watsonii]ADJ29807.1 integral membrane protein MviN [Nitrosococcus watsonii C-113]
MSSTRLLKSTAVVGSATLLSRVLGFIRDVVIAQAFGAGTAADSFFVAFKIPNFLRRLFAEGAFSQAFVPVLSAYQVRGNFNEIQQLVNRVAGTLGLVLLLVTLTGVIGAPFLVMVFAPGFIEEQDKYALTVHLLRITFPYLLFISLTAFAAGILNTYKQFSVPAITPIFLNLALIAAVLWFAPQMEIPVTALAWGVFFAGLAQLLFQLPFLARLDLLPKLRPRWKDPGVQQIFKLMLPAIVGSSVAQINLLIDTLLASFLVTGSVSWLYYSDRLVEFPLGVFGIALATVILPSLSEKHARASGESFARTLDWALRWVFLIGAPAAIGLVILAEPILTTLFQYGEFESHDVIMASRSLIAYSFGLLPFILIKILAPGFYARQNTRTPVRIAIIAMIANMVLNGVLIFPLAHAGLALATSLSAWLNASLLFFTLKRQGIYQPRPGWWWFGLRIIIASSFMAFTLLWLMPSLTNWLNWEATVRTMRIMSLIGAAVLVYFGSLLLIGVRPRMLTSA